MKKDSPAIEKQKDQTSLVESCAECGKRVKPTDKSFTSWIFRSSGCSCRGRGSSVARSASAPDKTNANQTEGDNLPTRELPEITNQFQATEFLGEGGMSRVYKVTDNNQQKPFAVKLLKPSAAKDGASFEHEIKVASMLDHANIVAVYEHGIAHDGSQFALMDFIDGASLADVLRKAVFVEEKRSIDLFIQICEGLSYAHSQGVLHLDLKPSNILVAQGETTIAKISDFGIAKVVTDSSQPIVETGALIGSILYMSPERCRGDLVDSRSDIYSLGCLMYEVLTGKAPFQAENPVKTMMKHLQDRPANFGADLKRLDVSHSLETIVLHCLEKDPKNRYQYSEEIIKDLELAKDGKEPCVANMQQLNIKSESKVTGKMVALAVCGLLLIVLWGIQLSQFDTFKQWVMVSYSCWYILILAGLWFGKHKTMQATRYFWSKSKEISNPAIRTEAFSFISFFTVNFWFAGIWLLTNVISSLLLTNQVVDLSECNLSLPDATISLWLEFVFVVGLACICWFFKRVRGHTVQLAKSEVDTTPPPATSPFG